MDPGRRPAPRPVDVIHFPDDRRPPRWQHPILALGNFDGLHRGHIKIIERVRRVATERAATALVMTKAQRLEGIERAGLDGVAVVRFTAELSRWDPETFVRTVLAEWLHASEVWVGANFLFGHDRAGNFSMLRSLGARYGFRTEKIDPVRYKDFVVSSTRIRRLISEGRVDEAAALLGHPYSVDGVVVAGDQRGRQIGFPTANLATENELIPPNGVYATIVRLDGVIYPAVTNVGVRPTFGDSAQTIIEAHLIDVNPDLYGQTLRLGFIQRMRDERRFDGIDALKAQIAADVAKARTLFEQMSL
jgi:riboflavin kinase/FMN adenylyltransferase